MGAIGRRSKCQSLAVLQIPVGVEEMAIEHKVKDVMLPYECQITLTCAGCQKIGVVKSDYDTPKGWYWLIFPEVNDDNLVFCSRACCGKWCDDN